jgi:signal transduction histidine kinase/ActR/RegA family two-component response regulator
MNQQRTAVAEQRILVVDDDPDIQWLLTEKATQRGWKCKAVATVEEAVELLDANPGITACILDMKLGHDLRAGLKVMNVIRERSLGLPVIVVTGHDEVEHEAMRGATLFLKKPVEIERVIELVGDTVGPIGAKLRQELDALGRYMDAMAVGVVVLDLDGVIRSINRAMVEHVEFTVRDVNQKIIEVLKGRYFGDLPANGFAEADPTEVVFKDRTYLVSTGKGPRKGKAEFFVQTWTDITKRKRATDLLRELPKLAARGLPDLLSELVKRIGHIGYPRVFVYLWNADKALITGGRFVCVEASGTLDPATARGTALAEDDVYVAAALATKKAVHIPRKPQYARSSSRPGPVTLAGVRSMVKVPLLSGGEIIGLLCLESLEEVTDFDDEDVELMDLLAGAIADAIEAARRHLDHKALERWAGPSRQIDHALTAGGELNEVFRIVVEHTARALGANLAWLLLPKGNADGPALTVRAVWTDETLPLPRAAVESYCHPGTVGLVRRALSRKAIDIIRDIQSDSDFQEFCRGIAGHTDLLRAVARLRSAVMIPVARGSEAIGVLGVYFTTAFEPTKPDTDNLHSVATLIGVALQRMRESELVMARAAQSGKVADLMLLGSGVAHALRNLLTEIRTSLDLAAREPTLEQVRSRVETARQSGRKMADRLERLIEWVRPEGLRPDTVLLGDIVATLRELIADKLESIGVEFHVIIEPGLPTVFGPPDGLKMAVLDLFVNALNAMTENTNRPRQLTVTARSAADPERVELQIEDTGHGMPSDQLDVFSRFDSPHEPPAGGVGLGLYLAHRFVTGAGGTIRIHSDPSRGTTVILSLPRDRHT